MKAEYIDHMGDDLRVANAARVSFNKESALDGGEIAERDTKLIKYLAGHDHWTPFAHCSVTIRETVPIFLARQRFKHTVGFVYNEVSRRYVDDESEFYEPKYWRKRAENIKQGSSDEEIKDMLMLEGDRYYSVPINLAYWEAVHACEKFYNSLIAAGGAPEQARMVLPQSMYTSYYVTGSLYAWSRLYLQRTKDNAQREWNELTPQIDEILRPLFPCSWSALVDS